MGGKLLWCDREADEAQHRFRQLRRLRSRQRLTYTVDTLGSGVAGESNTLVLAISPYGSNDVRHYGVNGRPPTRKPSRQR